MNYLIILLLQFYSAGFHTPQSKQGKASGDIIVHVEEIEDIKGDLLVGIYDSKRTFRKVKKVYKFEVASVKSEREVVTLKDVPSGTYAVVIFQDFNGNRKFDSNMLGIPKEPFGFSNNFKVKRRAPKFQEVTFEHQGGSTEMTIEIQKW